jgi:hypothetical protein
MGLPTAFLAAIGIRFIVRSMSAIQRALQLLLTLILVQPGIILIMAVGALMMAVAMHTMDMIDIIGITNTKSVAQVAVVAAVKNKTRTRLAAYKTLSLAHVFLDFCEIINDAQIVI